MLITGIIATATAAKWILAGKIMIATGTTMTTLYSLGEKIKENQKKG